MSSILKKFKRILIGKPLKDDELEGERYKVLWGLPILSSDAISSVAYAGQEILLVLIPVIGLLAYKYVLGISAAVILLLFIIMISYRQTISAYPNGGGAYIVAKDNLGIIAGATAGAALSIDYILTVAVSVSSGVEQLTSAFPGFEHLKVLISVIFILIITLGNLRGIRESSKMFGLPAYLFIFSILTLIIGGFTKYFMGVPIEHVTVPSDYYGVGSITLFLVLRAFSNGCTALSGVEAISNAVPNFAKPSVDNAKKVLLWLFAIIIVLFGGTSVLAFMYHVTPGEGQPTVLIQLGDMIFGRSTFFTASLFYLLTTTLVMILILASNTAFSGFPTLLSIMATEEYVPRQLKMRGDRLSHSNGIIILSLLSTILVVAFKANVTKLIGLYAIGVFISFTLSQSGMLIHWFKYKGKHWQLKASVNGFGAVITFITVIIVAVTKFTEGAWIVVIIVPIFVYCMMKVKGHYMSISKQLRFDKETFQELIKTPYRNRTIVLLPSVNLSSLRALRYAKTMSGSTTAFCVALNAEYAEKVQMQYNELNCDIPLVIQISEYRKVVEPLLDYIKSTAYDYKKGDMITVIMPEFIVKKRWQRILHNHTKYFIERELLKNKHIVVTDIPLQLKDI